MFRSRSTRTVVALVAALTIVPLTAQGATKTTKKKAARAKATKSATATKAAAPTTAAVAVTTVPAKRKLRVAVITPSAKTDLAFSQSMYDAMTVFQKQRGSLDVSYSDNLGNVTDASVAIRDYASKGYDLVIAHGSQYGALLKEIAPQFPKVAFAWGTAGDTFGLPNVFAYEAQADQGGFINGVMAGLMTKSKVIGVVGPIEVGDAKLYIDGFKKGVEAAKTGASVEVNYIKSFGDVALAAAAARTFAIAGADVLSGTAQMVVGAIPVTEQIGAAWFGTQANQSRLSKKAVVASQVYRWEVVLDDIVANIEAGKLGGKSYKIDFANKGLSIEFNPDRKIDPAVKARAEELVKGFQAGTQKSGI